MDFFGLPFKLQARAASGKTLGTLAWKAPTDTVKKALLAIPGARRALVKTRGGGFARILSPQLSPSSYPSFKKYVGSLKGKQLTVRGDFFGNPFQSFDYAGPFMGAATTTLSGTIKPQGGSRAPGQALSVAGSTLPSAIYTVDGPYALRLGRRHSHGLRQRCLRGHLPRSDRRLRLGLLGRQVRQRQRRVAEQASVRGRPRDEDPYAAYNEYAAVVYKYSNAYGFSFSDTGPKKVQLPLDNAATLRVTILPDRTKR